MTDKKKHRKPHFDFGETSAIPEIRINSDEPEIDQPEANDEGNMRIITDDVAVPEVLKKD